MKWCLIVLALASPAVGAQQVHKCVDKGQVSYQSQPCAGKTERSWDAAPVAEQSNAEKWRLYRIDQELRQRNRQPTSASSGAMVRNAPSSGCAAAKAHRQSVLDSVGLRRTHDLLRSLDDAVYRACK